MSTDTQAAGFLLAVAALIMTAIFPVFGKIKRVKSTNINPMIFNVYFQSGVVIFCLISTIVLAIVGEHSIQFSYMGLTSGILLGIGGWFVWLALTYMGIAHTSAIASGIASVTGFIEGITIGYYPDHIILSIFALFLIVLGIVGIGLNETLTSFIMTRILCKNDDEMVTMLTLNADANSNVSYKSPEVLFRFSDNPYTAIDNAYGEDNDISINTVQTEMDPLKQEEESDDDMKIADNERDTEALLQRPTQAQTAAITVRFVLICVTICNMHKFTLIFFFFFVCDI